MARGCAREVQVLVLDPPLQKVNQIPVQAGTEVNALQQAVEALGHAPEAGGLGSGSWDEAGGSDKGSPS